MNKIAKYISLACAFMAAVACEKTLLDDNIQWQYVNSATDANLKVVNAYTSNVPAGAPGVGVTRFYVYQDKAKLNGNALSAPGSWPSTATYAAIKAGKANYFLLLDRRVGNDYGTYVKGDTAFKANLDLQAGKFYTAFLLGASPTQEVMLVEDDMSEVPVGKYRLRVANLVPDPARPIDVYSRREKRKIVTGLDYKKVASFIELSIPNISDTLDVFDASSPTRPIYSYVTLLPVSKRVYTFYAQGRRGFRNEGLNIYINR